MIFNRFSILLTVRLALIFANLVILANIFGRSDLFFNQIILAVILIIQLFEILYYVSRTNRDLAKFILAIQEADFTTSFTGGPMDGSFSRLYQSFRDILETIRISKLEKEAQHRYLQAIIDRINVGIISIDANGGIELMNKKAIDLLNTPHVKSWQLLKTESTQFFEQVSQLENEDNRLIEVAVSEGKRQLSVSVTEVRILEETFRVVTFKDIKSELDKKEIEAWHKLIRILTHEIMNSVTPMVSLTETMKMLLEDPAGKQKPLSGLTDETIEDLRFSLQTINSRSEGLLHFVEDYRKLTKIPKPQLEPLKVKALIERVIKLLDAEFEKSKTETNILVEEDLIIQGDPVLLEQVLINLLTNAIQAMETIAAPNIKIEVYRQANASLISIKDNGLGIEENKLDSIFVPFFSTKEHGSGIGLSLCQQIMNLHGGFIEVISTQGEGAQFKLTFPD